MIFSGFSENGNWYKGNLHCHTTITDGKKQAHEIAKIYQDNGYSFIAITDHDIFYDHREALQNKDLLIIPAVEISAYLVDDKEHFEKVSQYENADSLDILWDENKMKKCKQTHHVNAFLGTSQMQKNATLPMLSQGEVVPPPMFFGEWNAKEVLQKMVNSFADRGFFMSYNHPSWSNIMLDQVSGVSGLWSVEVYNHSCQVHTSNGFDDRFIDMMISDGNNFKILATDDNHNVNGNSDSFGGYVMVKSETLEHDDIVNNLLNGNYYSSTGCDIYDWGIKDGEVYIECEDCRAIRFAVGGRVGDGKTFRSDNGTALIGAKYKLQGHEKTVRIECLNKVGQRAWTNICYINR